MKKTENQKKILTKNMATKVTTRQKKTATSQTKRREESDFVIPDENEKEVVLRAKENLSSKSFLRM